MMIDCLCTNSFNFFYLFNKLEIINLVRYLSLKSFSIMSFVKGTIHCTINLTFPHFEFILITQLYPFIPHCLLNFDSVILLPSTTEHASYLSG